MKKTFYSWGNISHVHSEYLTLENRYKKISFNRNQKVQYLTIGKGRSYGDVGLNSQGLMIETKLLNRIITIDEKNQTITCESGCTFEEIIHFLIPRGFFLSVTPGTKFITLGGAIANDVHGKNHHSSGTFGNHVLQFELLRSDGNTYLCSSTENSDYFFATIGGLGLTGIILWATFQIKNIHSSDMNIEKISFNDKKEFYELNEQSHKNFEYTVSWFDCSYFIKSKGNLRGIYSRGNHSDSLKLNQKHPLTIYKNSISKIPFSNLPLINIPYFLHSLNSIYFNLNLLKAKKRRLPYESYFYPLDGIPNWNTFYGKKGFYQHQSVIPLTHCELVLKEISTVIKKYHHTSFISVLKTFGSIPSRGHLRFARPGITLSLDFKNEGAKTHSMFLELNEIIKQANGALNPSKDSFMDSSHFLKLLSCDWNHFSRFIDPQFQSDLYKRILA